MCSRDGLMPSFSSRRGYHIHFPHDHKHPVATPKTGLLSVRPPTPYPRCKPSLSSYWWPETGTKNKINRSKAGGVGSRRRGPRGRKCRKGHRLASHADAEGSEEPCRADLDGDGMVFDSQTMDLDLEADAQDGERTVLAMGISNMSVDA